MKLRNTLKNKAKLFAQYYSQNIYYVKIEDAEDKGPFEIDFKDWRVRCEDSYLKLKPLSSITDEDAIYLSNLTQGLLANAKDPLNHGLSLSRRYDLSSRLVDLETADYLRSKGYGLPWMGLSVEDLVEYGWVKLIKEQ